MNAEPPRTPPRAPPQPATDYPAPPAAPMVQRIPRAAMPPMAHRAPIILSNSFNSNNNAEGNILPIIPPPAPSNNNNYNFPNNPFMHYLAAPDHPPINEDVALANLQNMPPPPVNPYANLVANNIRINDKIFEPGTINTITYENIVNGDEMIDFHNEAARINEPRYYKLSTLNQMHVNNQLYKLNPYTRRRIMPENIKLYTARIPAPAPLLSSPMVGRKRKFNELRGGKRSRRHRRRQTRRRRYAN